MTALLLIAVLVLVLVNGFFVAAEFALVRARRARVEQMAEEGLTGSRAALEELDDITEYLSACQLGITLASIGIGFLGEPAVATLIEPVFGNLSHGVAVAISVVIAYVLVTGLHITVGEQVPKVLAIQRADRMIRRISRPLHFFRTVARPGVTLLNAISNGILRLFGIRGEDIGETDAGSPEELKLIISESLEVGHLDPGEAGMLTGVFHLHEQEARQVMTPIPAVVTVDSSAAVKAAMERCITTGHTRLLVIEEENPDRVRGIVHLSRLARTFIEAGEHAPIEPLVRDAPIVPETKPLDDMLAELQRQRTEMAVVVDEYGRVVGIITLEDIIEEVVGEIEDETDPAGGSIRRLANGDWYVRGEVAITDLLDYGLELPVDTDAYNSVGGFVFAELGRLPKRGDSITADGYSIRVESVRENRIEAVRIRERAPAA